MRKFIQKVQTIGNKAAQIQEAIKGAPPKIAEMRQAMTSSAEELHKLRTDVQANLNGLRAHTEHRMVQAMHEIHDSTGIWAEAGYQLTGMDLDLALNQRLAVHLEKVEDVPHDQIRSLLVREKNETIKSILGGLIKAEETADSIDFSELIYHGVTIHVGAAPVIRMSWKNETVAEKFVVTTTAPPAASQAPTSFPPPESMFAQRPPAAPAPVSAPVVSAMASAPEAAPVASPALPEPASKSGESHWGSSALDRFKKMPNLSKHRG